MQSIEQPARFPAWFIRLIWLLLPLSIIAVIEPSPHDMLLLSLFWMGIMFSYFRFPKSIGIPMILLTLFLICNIIGVIFSADDQVVALRYTAITLYLSIAGLFWVGILNRFGKELPYIILSSYAIAALLAACLGISAYFHIIPQSHLFLEFNRAVGLFKDPNVFGPFLVPGAIIALWKLQGSTTFRLKSFWTCVLFLISVGVLLSFSRAAWGNYVLTFSMYFVCSKALTLSKKIVSVALLIFLFLPGLMLIINNPKVSDLFLGRLSLQHYDNSRFGTQQTAMNKVYSDPFGVGPGQSDILYTTTTHSLYVRVISENGWLGFLSFFGFVLMSYYRAISMCFRKNELQTYYAIVAVSLAGVLFNSFFIDTLHWRHFWLLLALPWIRTEGGKNHKNRADYHESG